MQHKACSKCRRILELCFFYRDKSKRFGIGSFCKTCSSEYARRKYDLNQKQIKNRVTLWQLANPDKRKIHLHRYYVNNAEKAAQYGRNWTKRNRQWVNERARNYYHSDRDKFIARMKKWRDKNGDILRRLSKQWREKHPEKVKDYLQKRRSHVEDGEDCSHKIKLLSFVRFCHWCCVRLNDKNRTIDHVIPLSRGGKHISDNLVAACKSCNSSKHTKFIGEWKWEMAA